MAAASGEADTPEVVSGFKKALERKLKGESTDVMTIDEDE
jgi:hypothetical protein